MVTLLLLLFLEMGNGYDDEGSCGCAILARVIVANYVSACADGPNAPPNLSGHCITHIPRFCLYRVREGP
jgi:hypothetical protein